MWWLWRLWNKAMSSVNLEGCTVVIYGVSAKMIIIDEIKIHLNEAKIVIAEREPPVTLELVMSPAPISFAMPEIYDIEKERREHLKRCQPWKRRKKGK
jgi:hypothetical protein